MMVTWLRIILIVVLFIQINHIVESLPSIVFVNNLPMTYDKNGELVGFSESDSDLSSANAISNKRKPVKPVKIQEKSNIFKNSDFVTKSNFRGGLVTKQNFTWNLPTRISIVDTLKKPSNYYQKYDKKQYPTTSTTAYPMISSIRPDTYATFLYDDDLTPVQNTLNSTYDEIYKNEYYFPVTETPNRPTIGSLHDNPVIIIYSTPSPTNVAQPLIVSDEKPTKKPKKKKKPKVTTTTTTTTTSTTFQPPTQNIQDHFLGNLEFYKKVLGVNCTNNAKNKSSEAFYDNATVEVTPKPIKSSNKVDRIKNNNDKYINEGDSDDEDKKHKDKDKKDKKDKDKKDKKCKCELILNDLNHTISRSK
jgi:hypothetical protein